MNVFDIIGPVMIGPSSSHTLGAARAGLVARRLLGEEVARADVLLFGSFAQTYAGHGTDRAIVGGLLGFPPDDTRLRDSFRYARKACMEVHFSLSGEEAAHPNTVRLALCGKDGGSVSVVVQSVGAGAVHVVEIDGALVSFSAEYETTVIFNVDRPGIVARVSALFADYGINIAFMRVFRKYEGKDAIMVIETDQTVAGGILDALRTEGNIARVITIPPLNV